MDLNLQQMPCFCSKVVFWCIMRYEGWKSRVLGQLGCMEDENKVCFGSGLQEVKVVYVLQSCFNYKQESGSVQCRPVPSLMYAATFSLETCYLDLILASENGPLCSKIMF